MNRQYRDIDIGYPGKILALFAVILAFAAMDAGAGYRHEEAVKKTINLKGAVRVIVESMSGDITVTGEEGRDDIEVKVNKVVNASSEAAAREIIEKMGIVVTRPEGAVMIETHYPKKGDVSKSIFSFFLGRNTGMSIELIITVPKEIAIDLATASGDTYLSRISGEVSVSSASGDMEIRGIDGDISVAAASGSITIIDISGDAKVDNASGDIYARNVGGNAAISTAVGETELTDIGGSLILNSHTGDVMVRGVGTVTYEGISGTAKFIDVRGGIDASAASGDLIFRVVPEGTVDYSIATSSGNVKLRFLKIMKEGYVLRASTTSGEIEAQLPISITKVDRNMIVGVVREGRSKVLLETASGDISVEEPEE